ncbi:MAG: 1-deoxy-D-xylulose-5-phosphate reductoisomerase [Brevinematia bacterium]
MKDKALKKRVLLLGATGSIGTSTLDVIKKYPDDFELVGVSCHKNLKKLEEIIDGFGVKFVLLSQQDFNLEKKYPDVRFFSGEDGLEELIFDRRIDTIVIAISGIAGLLPTIKAIQSGKTIISANKESLVAAGELIKELLKQHNQRILPVDSEHNALFNLISRIDRKYIKKIILTASGGPFFKKEITRSISINDVLSHPTWNMGNYITVNSATMINKGFEVIEAHFLFDFDYDKIEVFIHPQSLTHGIVETIDGSYFMVTSPNDMRYPIALSLFYPEIPEQKFKPLNIFEKSLEFYRVNHKKFPLLNFCYEMGKMGGLAPTVLNAANEFYVESFLKGLISFIKLPEYIISATQKFIEKEKLPTHYTLEDVFVVDREVKKFCKELIL